MLRASGCKLRPRPCPARDPGTHARPLRGASDRGWYLLCWEHPPSFVPALTSPGLPGVTWVLPLTRTG
jgi:hypothetical protein